MSILREITVDGDILPRDQLIEELVKQILRDIKHDPIQFIRENHQRIHKENRELYKYIMEKAVGARIIIGDDAALWDQMMWSYIYAYRISLTEIDHTEVPRVRQRDLVILDQEKRMLGRFNNNEAVGYIAERFNHIISKNPAFMIGVNSFEPLAKDIFPSINSLEGMEPALTFEAAMVRAYDATRVGYTVLRFPPERTAL